jgi:hypothetical protein
MFSVSKTTASYFDSGAFVRSGRITGNHFPPQMLAFTAPTFFWPYNLSQERYNFWESASKKEIPVSKP